MQLGDLLRSTLPGDPAVIREAAAASETSLDDDRRQQRTVLAYADRLEAGLAEIDRLREPLDAAGDDLRLVPLRTLHDDRATPWWAWPRVSTILGTGTGRMTTEPASMALVDAVWQAVTTWRATDGDGLDGLLAQAASSTTCTGPPAGPASSSLSSSSSSKATPERLLLLARVPAAAGESAEVTRVLADADRMMTLLVATPDGLVLRHLWSNPETAVLAVGDGRSDATSMLAPDTVAATLAVLTGLEDVAEDAGASDPAGWDTVIDRADAENLLSLDAGARAQAIEALRAGPAGHGVGDGPWRAWCVTVIRPQDGVVDGSSVIVIDTPGGHLLARPLADWATLRPVSTTTVRAVLDALATW